MTCSSASLYAPCWQLHSPKHLSFNLQLGRSEYLTPETSHFLFTYTIGNELSAIYQGFMYYRYMIFSLPPIYYWMSLNSPLLPGQLLQFVGNVVMLRNLSTKNTQTYAQSHTCACMFAYIQRARRRREGERERMRLTDTLESTCFKIKYFMKLVLKFVLKTSLI